jgi:AraC-like DNA-binding protein
LKVNQNAMQFSEFDDFTTLRFSTADVPAAERVAHVQDAVGRFLRFAIEPAPGSQFHAEVALNSLPGLRIMAMHCLGLRAERTPELAADGNDCFYFKIMCGANALIRHDRKEIILEHGEAMLMSAADPVSIICPTTSRSLFVLIPSATLALLVADVRDAVMRPIRRGNEALKLLSAYLGCLNYGPALSSPDLRRNVASHIYDLAVLAVRATGAVAEAANDRGVPAGRLSAIKIDIIANLSDAALSIESSAARHGVSPRYVRKLFENEGTTFSEFILGQRLVHAHRLLTAPEFDDMAIGAVALDCGFGDLSYFNRTFRRSYGVSPKEVREQAKYIRQLTPQSDKTPAERPNPRPRKQ